MAPDAAVPEATDRTPPAPTPGRAGGAGGASPTHRLRDLDRRGRLLALTAAVLLLLPGGASLARAVDQGWVPSSDDAQIVLRARDVLSSSPPLVGQPSTAGQYAESHPARHPGPIEFYLLAVPVRVLGPTWGALLTMAAVTGTSLLLAAWVAFRRGGPAVGLGAVALLATVTWSTGTAVLTDPLSSNAGGYPLLAGTALAWALWGDDRRLWPVAVAVWSFTAQQHLAILGPAGVVAAWGVLAALVTTARARRWRESARWAAAAVVVGLVCWLPPLVDQVVGDGNLLRILGFSRQGERGTIGLRVAVRPVARAVGAPPFFVRRDLNGAALLAPLSTGAVLGAVVGVVASVAVAGAAVARMRRASGPDASAARARVALVATGLVVALAGLVTAANVPDSQEQLRINFYRWAWPVAVALWGAVAWAVADLVAARVAARVRRRPDGRPGGGRGRAQVAAAPVVLALVAVVVGLAATGDGANDKRRDALLFRFEADAAAAVLDAVDHDRPVHVATRGQAAFLSLTPALVLALEDAGLDVRLETTEAGTVDAAQGAGYGDHRLELDDDPGARVFVVTGRQPLPEVPGEVVAELDLTEPVAAAAARVLAPTDGAAFVPGPEAEAVRARVAPEAQGYVDLVVAQFATDPAEALHSSLAVDLVEAGYFASPRLDPDALRALRAAIDRGVEVWGDDTFRIVVERLD